MPRDRRSAAPAPTKSYTYTVTTEEPLRSPLQNALLAASIEGAGKQFEMTWGVGESQFDSDLRWGTRKFTVTIPGSVCRTETSTGKVQIADSQLTMGVVMKCVFGADTESIKYKLSRGYGQAFLDNLQPDSWAGTPDEFAAKSGTASVEVIPGTELSVLMKEPGVEKLAGNDVLRHTSSGSGSSARLDTTLSANGRLRSFDNKVEVTNSKFDYKKADIPMKLLKPEGSAPVMLSLSLEKPITKPIMESDWRESSHDQMEEESTESAVILGDADWDTCDDADSNWTIVP